MNYDIKSSDAEAINEPSRMPKLPTRSCEPTCSCDTCQEFWAVYYYPPGEPPFEEEYEDSGEVQNLHDCVR